MAPKTGSKKPVETWRPERDLDCMHQPLESIRSTVSLHLPCSLFISLPRVRRPCGVVDDADRLPVVVRFPAGPQVSLKCGDQSKDNGAGHKKIYLPRVANGIADDLAGQATQFLLAKYRSNPAAFNRNAGPVSIKPSFPTGLFQVGGFHIQSFEQPWSQPILTLVERPSIDHDLLRKHVTLHLHHRQLIESYLSPCLPQNCSIEIDYSPKAADNHGRRYCCTVGGQRLPRAARLLLFGRTHCEIDLKGSFYELVRRLGLLFAPDLVPLPNIDEFRAQLARDPYIQKVEAICPGIIKQLPLRIINSSLDATYRYLSSLVDDSPSASVSTILCQLGSLSTTLTTQLLPRFRPEFLVNHSDSAFRLLEHFEATIVEDTIRALIARHPTQSLVWLHDGFLVAPPPPEQMVRQIEKEVLSKHQLYFGQAWFKVTSLTTARNAYVDTLKHTASSHALSLTRRTSHNSQRKQRSAQGSPHIYTTPLEALAKLRARRELPT